MILFKRNNKVHSDSTNNVKVNVNDSTNDVIINHLLTIKQDIGEMKSDINKTKQSINTLFKLINRSK